MSQTCVLLQGLQHSKDLINVCWIELDFPLTSRKCSLSLGARAYRMRYSQGAGILGLDWTAPSLYNRASLSFLKEKSWEPQFLKAQTNPPTSSNPGTTSYRYIFKKTHTNDTANTYYYSLSASCVLGAMSSTQRTYPHNDYPRVKDRGSEALKS